MQRVLRAMQSFLAELTAARRTRESVRGKLMRVVSLTTVIALLVAGSALLWHELTAYRHSWTSDLTTEAAILSIAMQTLQAFGYSVLTASDGAEAVAIYAQHRHEIDVVLTDMSMPFMDGAANSTEARSSMRMAA